MPKIDLSILNQRQTPAFYADTLANRPAAGFIGRIFVSTNTFELYRDNGTSWDLIGGPGAGTVTGSGAAGQVAFWNAASTITGSNDLFWDNVNGHLGIGTITPGTALDVKHDQNTVVQLEQSVATNDNRIAFINNGVGLWRLGAFYNAGANDFGLFDIVNSAARVTVKNTGQTFIGPQQSSSGKLVVVATARDNGIILIGTDAPGFRINDGTEQRQVGIAMSTGANDFIQGSVNRDFCIFNASKAAASPILFGIHDATPNFVIEAARISPARNFLIGTTTDGGQKLQVNGGARATGYFLDGMTAGAGALYYSSTGNRVTLANYNASGIVIFEVNGGIEAARINASNELLINRTLDFNAGTYTTQSLQVTNGIGINSDIADRVSRLTFLGDSATGNGIIDWGGNGNFDLILSNNTNTRAVIKGNGNFLIGTTTDAGQKLQVAGRANFVLPVGSNDQIITIARSGGAYAWSIGIDGTLSNFNFYNNGGFGVASINNTTGVYTALSDINKKKNFEKSNLGLETVLKLKPTLYNMISQSDHEAKELGLIAQEVKDIIPQAYQESGNFIGLNYQAIVVTLVKAIQDLNTKIENLK